MEKDAVSAGVAPVGGLFSTAEIKILICYILTEIGEPVPSENLVNLLHYESIANAFEVSDAFHSLEKGGMIIPTADNNGCYEITDSGKNINATLKDSLPQTVKSRALKAAKKMVARYRNEKNSTITVSNENGRTYITCTALDGSYPFLSFTLPITDERQINRIKENFLENSPEICSKVIDLLTQT